MGTRSIMGIRKFAVAILIATTSGAAIAYRQEPTPASRTVWDGAYSSEQEERGVNLFSQACASCHGEDMRGGAGTPTLAGPEFQFGWEGKTLGDLFEYVSTNMPVGQAGTLSDEQYANLLAAILKQNEFPPGETELTPGRNTLDAIRITRSKP